MISDSITNVSRLAFVAILLACIIPGAASAQIVTNASPPLPAGAQEAVKPGSGSAEVTPASTITIPAGTRMIIEVHSFVHKKRAHGRQEFYFEPRTPLVLADKVVIPAGTKLHGTSCERESSLFARRTSYKCQFTRLVFSNGYSVPLDGSLQSLRHSTWDQTFSVVGATFATAVGAIVGSLFGHASSVGPHGGAAIGGAFALGLLTLQRRVDEIPLQPGDVRNSVAA